MKLGLVAGLILLLFKVLAGKYAILAFPLAESLTSTVHASQLCPILFIRLQTKVKTYIGIQRLLQRWESVKMRTLTSSNPKR
jgi:hypothetical protein